MNLPEQAPNRRVACSPRSAARSTVEARSRDHQGLLSREIAVHTADMQQRGTAFSGLQYVFEIKEQREFECGRTSELTSRDRIVHSDHPAFSQQGQFMPEDHHPAYDHVGIGKSRSQTYIP